jgi:hypothetical protein
MSFDISELWICIEENIKVSLDAWTSYYSRLLFINKELAERLVIIDTKYKLLQFIIALDRKKRPIETINKLLCQLNTWIVVFFSSND